MTELKKVLPWLKEAESTALQSSLRNLSNAFSAYFEKSAEKPVFHKKGSHDSYTCRNNSDSIRIIDDHHVQLPKLGIVKVRGLREINGRILNATVTKETTGKWYLSLQYETEIRDTYPLTGNTVGIDLGIHDFIVLSDGTGICNPKIYAKYEKKLIREQKKLSRMFNANVSHYTERNGKKYPVLKRPLKECMNYQKQKKVIAKIHEKIRNTRRDFEHKISTDLIKNHDVICMEDLDIKGMLETKKMSKEISDVSWSEFTRMLEYKAEQHGRKIIRTDRYFPSSQKCHVCGHIQKENKDLRIRRWECPVCHTIHDRDINAAINIREKGMSMMIRHA
jgi:putative transposase